MSVVTEYQADAERKLARDLAVLAGETRYGRNAGMQDHRRGSYDPQSNPWLPLVRADRFDRARAQAWADGYVEGWRFASIGLPV